MIKNISLIVALMFVGACSSYTSVETTYISEPSTDFILEKKPVVLVNNSLDAQGTDFIDVIFSNGMRRRLNADATTGLNDFAVNVLGQEMLRSGKFEDILVYGNGESGDWKGSYYLPDPEIEVISQNSSTDLVLAMDSINVWVIIKEQTVPDYDVVASQLNVVVNPYYSLYDAQDASFYESFEFNDTIQWNTMGKDFQAAINSLPALDSCIYDAVYWTMADVYKKWISYEYQVTRQYLHHSSPAFREAKYLVSTGYGDQAYDLWSEIYNTTDKSDFKYRAACNISLYYEQNGDINQAILWLEKAKSISNVDPQLKSTFDIDKQIDRLRSLASIQARL